MNCNCREVLKVLAAMAAANLTTSVLANATTFRSASILTRIRTVEGSRYAVVEISRRGVHRVEFVLA